jgi:hypothetical protein
MRGADAPPSRWSPADLWVFTQAWVLLLIADLGLRTFPFARLDRWLTPAVQGRKADEATVGRLVWATAAAARHHLYPMRCLPQAFCLRRLLRRHGIAADLKIGVARQDGALAAHAWVEREGRPVGEASAIEQRFATLGSA